MKYLQLVLVLSLGVMLAACHHEGGDHNHGAKSSTPEPVVTVETSSPTPEAEATGELAVIPEGKYAAYSAEAAGALKGEQKFGVFFHADWCPTCVKWEERTSAALDQLPAGTKILKANYDTETDLIKELHVKKQSSMVFFDANGEIYDTVSDPSVEAITEFFTTPDFDVLGAAGERYTEYNEATFNAAKGNEKMVAFFHADWCGTCRKWEKNLQANLDTLDSSARVVKVDYDTQTALAKEFGVTKQSTAVFLNADGSVAKSEGDPSLDSINEFFTS